MESIERARVNLDRAQEIAASLLRDLEGKHIVDDAAILAVVAERVLAERERCAKKAEELILSNRIYDIPADIRSGK